MRRLEVIPVHTPRDVHTHTHTHALPECVLVALWTQFLLFFQMKSGEKLGQKLPESSFQHWKCTRGHALVPVIGRLFALGGVSLSEGMCLSPCARLSFRYSLVIMTKRSQPLQLHQTALKRI